MQAGRVQALGALRSLQSKMKLVAEKRLEMHFLSNKEKEQWIEDYVERETTVGRKRVEDAEKAIKQEQENMKNAGNAGLTTRMCENTFEMIMDVIGSSLSTLALSDDEEDAEDLEDAESDTGLGMLSEDDRPSWVMGTISKIVQLSMERFRQKQMKIDELTQPGWGDAVYCFFETDMKCGTAEIKVPAVVTPQTDNVAATPARTTFGEVI